MDLFEYQGKRFFSKYGIPTSAGEVVETVEDALKAVRLVGYPAVIKAQVQVGGRGKAGGIRLVTTDTEATDAVKAILGMNIKGHIAHRVWIEHASDIEKEYYVSVTLDRGAKEILVMVSAKGGVDIEEVAVSDPEAIKRIYVNPIDGLSNDAAFKLVSESGIDQKAIAGVSETLVKLYDAYIDGDADLLEINPLILTPQGRIHALDAKVSLDDNALFRHPEWDEFRATQELDGREKLAKERHLNYIGLDGTVGIIANGAGLAMSTLDVVTQVGGRAANFLDLGGGAGADVMAAALEVINTDDNVKAILVNIFGGITRCDQVALGIVDALSKVELRAPLVIRLDGTNAEKGREILNDHSGDALVIQPTMVEAARKAVELAERNS